ncbi:DUF2380 domain-containing protein [Paracoccus chinensis]|uniref:DUF2380 domain-containing protein n=1 Tax=Paracoccus chinensis TaxID=525640 RepID=A0A1G9H5Y3_9RHOB|nr:DUF2380 domain-containing protein [Paracoccus chinensis]SDL08295.1 Protein of unknown function [Paracoccus chinensis]
MRKLVLALALLPMPLMAQDLAIAPVKMLDTSREARDQQSDHDRRLALMEGILADELSGTLVSREEISAACPRETTECLVAALRERGAERGLFIVVQKASTLILQAFASLVDLEGERLVTHTELSFRGDNDEAWRKAAHFLAGKLQTKG